MDLCPGRAHGPGARPLKRWAFSGALSDDPPTERRTVRLEASADGKSLLLVNVDGRKPGIHREVRYEITPAELIAAIRSATTRPAI